MSAHTLTLPIISPRLPPGSPAVSILALDLGTTTGWAIKPANRPIASGTVSFKPSRYDGGGMRNVLIQAVYFEEVRRHAGTDAAHIYGGFLACLSAWCEEHAIAYQGVPVGTIKRHATGKGNADKAAVIAALRERGFSPTDDNEADALAILIWALTTDGGVL